MTRKRSVRLLLFDLELGEREQFPIEQLTSIRAACSTYGLMWQRRFETRTDKQTRRVCVTRVE